LLRVSRRLKLGTLLLSYRLFSGLRDYEKSGIKQGAARFRPCSPTGLDESGQPQPSLRPCHPYKNFVARVMQTKTRAERIVVKPAFLASCGASGAPGSAPSGLFFPSLLRRANPERQDRKEDNPPDRRVDRQCEWQGEGHRLGLLEFNQSAAEIFWMKKQDRLAVGANFWLAITQNAGSGCF